MTPEEHVYDSPSGDFIFFFPNKNKITTNKIIGRDKQQNMPIVDTKNNESEWSVSNNEELEMALELMFNN